MREHLQNDTGKVIIFYMVDATDLKTPETGLTLTVTVSKNGAAFAAVTGTVAEIGNGFYKLTPSTADVNTLGASIFIATATGADDYPVEIQIVTLSPYVAMVGTNGAYTGTPPTTAQILTALQAAGTHLTVIKAVTDLFSFTGNDVKATLDGESVTVGNPNDCKADVSGIAMAASLTALRTVVDAMDIILQAVQIDTVNLDGASMLTAAEILTAIEADGTKLDHLWEMTEDDGGVRRLTVNALEQAPVGGGALTLAAKMQTNKAVQDKISGVITYYDDDGVTPILVFTPTDDGNETTRTPS